MPEKDPSFWAVVWLAISTSATWQGAIMATIIAFLRILYDGKETQWTRILLEALICGALSLSAASIVQYFNAPEQVTIAAGGAIGFIGVTTIREVLVRWLGKRSEA